MLKKLRKNINSLMITAISVLLILITLIALLAMFIRQSYKLSVSELEASISSVSEIVSVAIDNKFEDYFNNLYIASKGCSQIDDIGEIKKYLRQTNEQLSFRRISYVTPDGKAYNSNGADFEVTVTGQLKDVFDGKEMAIYETKSYYYSLPALILSVPVYKNGEVVAILMANSSIQGIEHAINLNIFDGNGYTHIITNKGDSVVLAENQENFYNFFTKIENSGEFLNMDSDRIIDDFANERSGLVYYNHNDSDKIAVYRPLERNNWYVLTIVPTQYATKSITNTIIRVTIISVLIVLLFAVILTYILVNSIKKKREIERNAYVDPVTQGSTKVKFYIDAVNLIKNNSPLTYSLISIDLYKFSIINDSFGISSGDEVLAFIYKSIKKYLASDEQVSRISGDNFNILKKTTDIYEIKKFLDNVSTEINSFNADLINKYYLQFYAGIYFINDTSLDVVKMEFCSNVARKISKKKRTTELYNYTIYEENQRLTQTKERYIDNHMEQALANGEFVMYLQPKIDLRTDKVGGAEALVRWNDPKFGLVPPGEFIPIFEENGFVRKVDLYIFEQAVKLVRSWLDRGIEPITISVNLSRIQLNNINFLDKYVRVLEMYDVPAKYFEMEVTESIVFNNVKLLIEIINKIHEAGFSCSIDDFGSGYSSLNMLKDMHVDVIKLDREFLKFSHNNEERSHQIIANVIQLVKSLGAKNVTEGVEKENEVNFLKSVGCDMIQGFYFSKPLPVKEFEVYYDEHR